MRSQLLFLLVGLGLLGTIDAAVSEPASSEYNPARQHPVALGASAARLIVGFRATPDNSTVKVLRSRRVGRSAVRVVQAQTSAADVEALVARAALRLDHSRQLTPSTHVLYLEQPLYGADVDVALAALRADPGVQFADVDQRRFAHAVPNDPLFVATSGATGQWYLQTPSATDPAATDTVSAWNLTQGSGGTVIADVDTGVRFEHPDLLRAGFGGRLLPGYDFVNEDYSRTTGAPLGTFLIANDGDGWDPDASDPGDWLTASDEMNALFPASVCGAPSDSSWHGTRVMGILGALTNNGVGIAALNWNSYDLPVRALGKCGGYDSDIITAMQWAAGLSASNVPDNPYPADIINLSLGGSGSCPSDYASVIDTLVSMGVLIVASAGNESGPVDAPGNCAGVLAVAGLRNVGTKVGYSSLGAEVGISAPAGNCVNSSGACLRSIDTTTNTGLTTPGDSSYTNQTNINVGTSFAAPIVSGVASLMRGVNANLTPAQLIARIQSSATAFPQPAGLPVCPQVASDGSGECACPNDGSQCGAGMVNAFAAVTAALRPIAAIATPATVVAGSNALFDASGSAAACNASVASYHWVASSGVTLVSGADAAQVTVIPTDAGGTLTLTVTDSAGATDTATVMLSGSGATTTAPATAGSAATACPAALALDIAAPTLGAAFSPASVTTNATSTLTLTLANANGFALTQAQLTVALPSGLQLATKSSSGTAVMPSTTCASPSGLTTTATSVALAGAIVPAAASCTISVPVEGTATGSYTASLASGALMTATAGANSVAANATLSVTAPSSRGGGGAVDWWDMLFVAGVLLAGRRGYNVRRR